MTLLLTAVSSKVIAMGADSAMTDHRSGQIMTLSNFPKVIPVTRYNLAITVAGSANVGRDRTWISNWLNSYVNDVAVSDNPTDFVQELANDLQTEALIDDQHVMQIGGWVDADDATGVTRRVPRLYEIHKLQGVNEVGIADLLGDQFMGEFLADESGHERHPLRLLSTGVPTGYSTWLKTEGVAAFSRLSGSPLPVDDIGSIVEFIRFAIKLIADLLRIARVDAVVAEPIETLALLPHNVNYVSQRY